MRAETARVYEIVTYDNLPEDEIKPLVIGILGVRSEGGQSRWSVAVSLAQVQTLRREPWVLGIFPRGSVSLLGDQLVFGESESGDFLAITPELED